MTLPIRFRERMTGLLGPEADELFDALARPPLTGLRVNTLKLSVEEFRALSPWPLTPVPWCATGFIIPDEAQSSDENVRPGKHPFHAAGLYYLQEPAAMAVAEALAPQPGELVLDLAAAPGGKSTHLVALAGDQGVLVANEIEASRARVLAGNLERWGARRAVVTQAEPNRLAERWGALFDRVLLDAPCSGEGMFRKSTSAVEMWSEENVRGCAARQARIIDDAAALVRPGGALVYSTCTFAPEENEQVIARFLTAHPDFALTMIDLPGVGRGRPDWVYQSDVETRHVASLRDGDVASPPNIASLHHTARIWPHRASGEGHFIARLTRADAPTARRPAADHKPAPRSAQQVWEAFARDTLGANPVQDLTLTLQGDRLYAMPNAMPPLEGVRVVQAGLWLGTLRPGRFEPSHSLALALRPADLTRLRGTDALFDLTPDDPRLTRYLQGHPLDAPDAPGWTLVAVAGFPLGWGRRAQGILKNAYPKGLRLPLR